MVKLTPQDRIKHMILNENICSHYAPLALNNVYHILINYRILYIKSFPDENFKYK